MRFRIVLQVETLGKGSSGQDTSTWATWKTRWADIDPLKGSELFTSQATEAAAEVVFRIRYLSGVNVRHRISWNSRTFDIKSVVNVKERNTEMMLYARERV